MDLTLADFLKKNDLNSSTTLVLRHGPPERRLAEVFTMLITSKHDVFNLYQSAQTVAVKKHLRGSAA